MVEAFARSAAHLTTIPPCLFTGPKQTGAEKPESRAKGPDGWTQERRGPPPVHSLHVHSPLPPAPLALGCFHSGELKRHSLVWKRADTEQETHACVKGNPHRVSWLGCICQMLSFVVVSLRFIYSVTNRFIDQLISQAVYASIHYV